MHAFGVARAVAGMALAGSVFMSAMTSAVEIAIYSFNGNNGTGNVAAAFDADNLTAGAITRGTGVTAFARTNSMAAYGWTSSGTPGANDYFQFTLTPATGYSLTLDDMIFGEQQVRNQFYADEDAQLWAVRSSRDGYTANLASGATTAPGSVGTHTIDLSGLGTLTSAVTFRIYGYDSSGFIFLPTINEWALVNYDTANNYGVTVTGDVALIPEPGAGLCLALGGAALLCRRRSRRRDHGSAATAATPAAA
ncbi:MAG: hypothetical protein GX595_07810 [Lentisphaerae bacterium]|nr:hypothetical protein [Lentisphaerota bacterium]